MASTIDATKPITGNPTTLSVRDNFAAAKSEIEALQTDKLEAASPAMTGDATITDATSPSLTLKDSGSVALTDLNATFTITDNDDIVGVSFGYEAAKALIDIDPANDLLGVGEFVIEISGNEAFQVDEDGVSVGNLTAERPTDFGRNALVVHAPFDDGITLYNTNSGFGDQIGIDFVGGDAAADTDYGEIIYDLGDGAFSFNCEGVLELYIDSAGINVGNTSQSVTVLDIDSSGGGSGTIQFNDNGATNRASIVYSHSPDILYFNYQGTTFMEVQGTVVDFGVFDARFDDNSIIALGSSQDMEIFHDGTHNYIDLNVGSLYVRDGTTTRFTFADSTGDFTATGNVTAYSDSRLKKDLVRIEDALDKIEQLTGYTYTRKDTGERQTGLIAQDVQKVLPEAVSQAADGTLALAYGNLLGLVVEAVKDLSARLDAIEGDK